MRLSARGWFSGVGGPAQAHTGAGTPDSKRGHVLGKGLVAVSWLNPQPSVSKTEQVLLSTNTLRALVDRWLTKSGDNPLNYGDSD